MIARAKSLVGIVDYHMGNLFSVQQACSHSGIDAVVTSDRNVIAAADGIILPGVGAFGDAMDTLRQLDLVDALKSAASEGKPFMGICLGIQLLMTESNEFGCHRGLDLIEGRVDKLNADENAGRRTKVPHVGWNRIYPCGDNSPGAWSGSPLENVAAGTHMYFVHSFYAKPAQTSLIIATTRYGGREFCSAIQKNNIFACQFHPERSGPEGLKVYAAFAARVLAWRNGAG